MGIDLVFQLVLDEELRVIGLTHIGKMVATRTSKRSAPMAPAACSAGLRPATAGRAWRVVQQAPQERMVRPGNIHELERCGKVQHLQRHTGRSRNRLAEAMPAKRAGSQQAAKPTQSASPRRNTTINAMAAAPIAKPATRKEPIRLARRMVHSGQYRQDGKTPPEETENGEYGGNGQQHAKLQIEMMAMVSPKGPWGICRAIRALHYQEARGPGRAGKSLLSALPRGYR